MKALKSSICVVGVVLISIACTAQPKTPPAWSAKFKSTINLQRVHSLGYVIVSTNDGLYAVNPADGKILCENKTL